MNDKLINLTKKHMKYLTQKLSNRYVGSKSNQQAGNYLKKELNKNNFETEKQLFDCFNWIENKVQLKINNIDYKANISPYSKKAEVEATLSSASNIEELESINDAENKIVLLKGELTKEQLVPKNFPFYNIDKHQKIIDILERKRFRAVIAATGIDKNTAGGVYPFPLFEDGDLLIPSVYIKDVIGNELVKYIGERVYLKIDTERFKSYGANIIGSKGNDNENKIVLFAHYDSKNNSPGALDNASGVTTLLILSNLLKEEKINKKVEIAFLNGEDYFSNPGQKVYFIDNQEMLKNISLGINIDGIGYYKGKVAFSLYNLDSKTEMIASKTFTNKYGINNGEKWYQGEHAILTQLGIPAIAFTSELLEEIMNIVHTNDDNLSIIDYKIITDTALALKEFIINI